MLRFGRNTPILNSEKVTKATIVATIRVAKALRPFAWDLVLRTGDIDHKGIKTGQSGHEGFYATSYRT